MGKSGFRVPGSGFRVPGFPKFEFRVPVQGSEVQVQHPWLECNWSCIWVPGTLPSIFPVVYRACLPASCCRSSPRSRPRPRCPPTSSASRRSGARARRHLHRHVLEPSDGLALTADRRDLQRRGPGRRARRPSAGASYLQLAPRPADGPHGFRGRVGDIGRTPFHGCLPGRSQPLRHNGPLAWSLRTPRADPKSRDLFLDEASRARHARAPDEQPRRHQRSGHRARADDCLPGRSGRPRPTACVRAARHPLAAHLQPLRRPRHPRPHTRRHLRRPVRRFASRRASLHPRPA